MKTIGEKRERNSNIELLRILSMMLIIMNHYCASIEYVQTKIWINKLFKILLGSWGALGVDIFVLISVWFLCDKELMYDIRKIMLLALQTIFYMIIWTMIANRVGFADMSIKTLLKIVAAPFIGSYWFVTAYICFYIMIPILNWLANSLSDKQLEHMVLVMTITVIMFQMLVLGNPTYGIISTFSYLFFLISYLKRKPNNLIKQHCRSISVGIYLLICICIFIGMEHGSSKLVEMVSEKYSIFTILLATSVFYEFETKKSIVSKTINAVASATFGIYLFHSGPIAERYLTVTVGNNSQHYMESGFIIHLVLFVLVIFVVGTFLDKIRKYLVEKPILKVMQRNNFIQREMHRINGLVQLREQDEK